jgi:hypothetical protein
VAGGDGAPRAGRPRRAAAAEATAASSLLLDGTPLIELRSIADVDHLLRLATQ